jgi:hypothetical protein
MNAQIKYSLRFIKNKAYEANKSYLSSIYENLKTLKSDMTQIQQTTYDRLTKTIHIKELFIPSTVPLS